MEKNIVKISRKDIEFKLSKLIHPEINYNLIELEMIRDIKISNDSVLITLALPFLEVPIKDNLIESIKKSIQKLGKDLKIEIKSVEMNEKEKNKFMKMANKGWRT